MMNLELDKNNLPHHVGIIMDGNGRWAEEKGLKRSAGHKAGAETLKKLCNHIYDLGIPVLSVYAFSTENFKRAQEENIFKFSPESFSLYSESTYAMSLFMMAASFR